MSASRSTVRPASGSGLSPQVVATSAIVIIVAAVATIFFLQGEKKEPEAAEPEVENPFEGLPPEPPPEPKGADGR